jgi:hypothetical protein
LSYGHTQQAKGYSVTPGTVKIAVTMPREHFEHMRLKALKNGISISHGLEWRVVMPKESHFAINDLLDIVEELTNIVEELNPGATEQIRRIRFLTKRAE